MIVSIHQPNFAPWLGYYQKIIQSDLFVLLDDVQYTKGGYQNRVCLSLNEGQEQWLTCPVQTKGRFLQATRDVQFASDSSWRRKHLRMLNVRYHRTSNFVQLWPWLENLYLDETVSLCSFNTNLIEWTLRVLGVSRKIVLSSEFSSEKSSTDRLVQLVDAVGGDVYLSGSGGRNYLDEEKFKAKNIDLKFSKFDGYVTDAGRRYFNTSALDFIFFEDTVEQQSFVRRSKQTVLID